MKLFLFKNFHKTIRQSHSWQNKNNHLTANKTFLVSQLVGKSFSNFSRVRPAKKHKQTPPPKDAFPDGRIPQASGSQSSPSHPGSDRCSCLFWTLCLASSASEELRCFLCCPASETSALPTCCHCHGLRRRLSSCLVSCFLTHPPSQWTLRKGPVFFVLFSSCLPLSRKKGIGWQGGKQGDTGNCLWEWGTDVHSTSRFADTGRPKQGNFGFLIKTNIISKFYYYNCHWPLRLRAICGSLTQCAFQACSCEFAFWIYVISICFKMLQKSFNCTEIKFQDYQQYIVGEGV